jgi:hypothetical protein
LGYEIVIDILGTELPELAFRPLAPLQERSTVAVGRIITTSKADFKAKLVSAMRSLQKKPCKIRAFYQKPSRKYAA